MNNVYTVEEAWAHWNKNAGDWCDSEKEFDGIRLIRVRNYEVEEIEDENQLKGWNYFVKCDDLEEKLVEHGGVVKVVGELHREWMEDEANGPENPEYW